MRVLQRASLSCRRALLPLTAVLCLAAPADLSAQTQIGDVIYSRQATFKIPYQTEAGERRIQRVELHVSDDQGRTWRQAATASPNDHRHFTYNSPRDGLYWFTVRTIDWENRAYPATLDRAEPGLKVVVDTQPPGIDLRPIPLRDSTVGVEWQVRDENLDPNSLVLEYRSGPTGNWQEVSIERIASGRKVWNPATNAALQVRLRARDRADNQNEATTNVSASSSSGWNAGASSEPPPRQPTAGPGGVATRLVNSKRISLNYEIKDVGPSDISVVELWYTPDGRNWQKHSEDTVHKPPYVVDVTDEGLFGFYLVARSGVGLGEQPPRAGDAPQIWVEVDLTKPVVQMRGVDVGRGPDSGNLAITWSASDKNLERQPISLFYADRAEGPWTTIATNLENNGRFVWRMPPGVPYRFHLKVEATDRAGNVGSALTDSAKPVIVDLSLPKVQVLGVEPATKP